MHQAAQGGLQRELAARAPGRGAGFDRTARRLPGLQAAVEHGHGVVAGPLQHPPQAAAVVGAVAVVHHGLHGVVETQRLQGLRKQLSFW